jgi:hypothetical protein
MSRDLKFDLQNPAVRTRMQQVSHEASPPDFELAVTAEQRART